MNKDNVRLIAVAIAILGIMIMSYMAGMAREEKNGCENIITQANRIVAECNEKIREATHVNEDFNFSSFLEKNNITLQWNKTTTTS